MSAETWTTKDGKVVKICEMSNKHLINTARMLKRNGWIGFDALNWYLFGPKPQGEYAQMAFEEELNRLSDMRVSKKVDMIEREIKRRGLKEEI